VQRVLLLRDGDAHRQTVLGQARRACSACAQLLPRGPGRTPLTGHPAEGVVTPPPAMLHFYIE
jgi:hypothetical protein